MAVGNKPDCRLLYAQLQRHTLEMASLNQAITSHNIERFRKEAERNSYYSFPWRSVRDNLKADMWKIDQELNDLESQRKNKDREIKKMIKKSEDCEVEIIMPTLLGRFFKNN